MPERDPTCSIRDCGRPSGGVLAIASPQGTVRVSACEEHARRVVGGERLPITVRGSALPLDQDAAHPANYEPRSA